MKHVRKRLTYANVMSSIAVFVAVGGGAALAAIQLPKNSVGTRELKPKAVKTGILARNAVRTGKLAPEAAKAGKIAKNAIPTNRLRNNAVSTDKIADLAVTGGKLADNSVTGSKVDESTLGVVPDASKLGGKSPAAYESKGSTTGPLGTKNLGASATTAVATLDLAAGTYLVIGGGVINSNSAAPVENVSCAVSAGGKTQKVNFGTLNKESEPGDRDAFSAPLVATLNSDGTATLECTTPAGWSGNLVTPSLSAVSLQS